MYINITSTGTWSSHHQNRKKNYTPTPVKHVVPQYSSHDIVNGSSKVAIPNVPTAGPRVPTILSKSDLILLIV